VPSAPANLTATPGNSQVTLSWSASSGAVSYSVYRGTFADGEDPVPISSGSPATGYTDSSVTNGTTYYYKVTAVNLNGESARSNEASATPNTLPTAPNNLTATAVSKSRIDLTWTNNDSSATSVSIERSTNGTHFAQTATVGGAASSYSDTGLVKNKKYYYRVRAVNSAGASDYSNVASATTLKH